MARGKNRSTPKTLKVTLPGDVFDYLVHLATNGKVDVTENGVAARIIVQRVEEMQRDKFHLVRTPK